MLAKLRDLPKCIRILLLHSVIHTAITIAAAVGISVFYTHLFTARLHRNFHRFALKTAGAVRRHVDSLLAELARGATCVATALAVWSVIASFYGWLYGARAVRRLRATQRETREALARGRLALLDKLHAFWHCAWSIDAIRRNSEILLVSTRLARTGLLKLPPPPRGYLGTAFQLLLFAVVFSLVLLRPIQAKAPTPSSNPLGDEETTPTPLFTPTQTLTPSPTFTATPTITPTPTMTPTVHITAVSPLDGPGYCGVVDGVTGTGEYVWPAVERKLSGYNYNPRYYHFGIDIAGKTGDNIYAADTGVVAFAGWHHQGYGYLVILDHGNGYQTVYAHLSRLLVECGDHATKGETIGAMGSTGWSTGPHLHFEIMTNRMERVNPWLYLEE